MHIITFIRSSLPVIMIMKEELRLHIEKGCVWCLLPVGVDMSSLSGRLSYGICHKCPLVSCLAWGRVAGNHDIPKRWEMSSGKCVV